MLGQTIITHFETEYYGKEVLYTEKEFEQELEFIAELITFDNELFLLHWEDEDGNDVIISSDALGEFIVSLANLTEDEIYMILGK